MSRLEPQRPNPTVDSGGRSSDDPHFGEMWWTVTLPLWARVARVGIGVCLLVLVVSGVTPPPPFIALAALALALSAFS